MAEKRDRFVWELRIAATLIATSVLFFAVHFAFYRDLQHIGFWTLTDLAFLPLSVLVTTLFIDRLLQYRDRALRLNKRNMLSGVFFSSLGNNLLARFFLWDSDVARLRQALGSPESWRGQMDDRQAAALLNGHPFEVSPTREGLQALRSLFMDRTDFLIRLLENPNLTEHESFSDLLLAVLHVSEELAARPDLGAIPDSDLHHLAGDVKRAYALLVREWAVHLGYLKISYPYLYSLALRTNPLDKSASPIVTTG
jgi:hypothetical protein